MDKKYTHCAECNKKFNKKDEVVSTNAEGGLSSVVHNDCLLGWLLRWSSQSYYDTHEEMITELKEEGELN